MNKHEDGLGERGGALETLRAALASGVLVERREALALIDGALVRARDGRGRLVVIDGPAGIGKTRLVEHAAQRARSGGYRLFVARGHELEQDHPFGVVRQLLERELAAASGPRRDTLLAGAAALSASVFGSEMFGSAGAAADGSYGLLHGIHWLVINLAAEQPVVLLVDDVHWSDELSLRALAYLGRRLDGLRVVIIVAARPPVQAGAHRDALASLSAEAAAVVVRPAPLSGAGTAALLGAIAPAAPAAAVAAIHELAGGNPFLIVEATRSLLAVGAPITPESVAGLADAASESLSQTIILRLPALGPDAATVSRAIAVLGDDGDLAQVCELSQLPRARVLSAVGTLTRACVVLDEMPLRFSHPLLRAAVYGDLSAIERAHCHERAAALLERFAADPARIAAHLLLSRPAADAGVAGRLIGAAQDATAKGHAELAVRYWRRALAEPPSTEQCPRALLGLGLAELAVGEPAAAVEHLRRALPLLHDAARRVQAALGLAQALMLTEGLHSAVDALDACRPGLDEDALLRLDVERTGIAVFIPAMAKDAAQRMRAFAELEGRTFSERLAPCSAALACTFDVSASARLAVSIATRATRRETLAADWAAHTMHHPPATGVLVYGEEFDTAEQALEGVLQASRASGSGYGFAVASLMLGISTLVQGQLVEAIGHIEAAVATAADLPRTKMVDRFFLAAPALLLAWALVERGAIDAAAAVVAEASAGRELHSPEHCPILVARGLVGLARGDDLDAALDDLLAYGAVCAQMGYEERVVLWRQRAAETAAALGRSEQAVALAQDGLQIARAWGGSRMPRRIPAGGRPRGRSG